MAVNKVELLSDGIKKALKNYTMYDSLAEYIWNGFDATATTVRINIIKNRFSVVESIEIIDDGYGIQYELLTAKFKPVFESNKAFERANLSHTSTFHGKNGVGRLTFFTFAHSAQWTTVYSDDNSKSQKYAITISADTLEEFPNTAPVITSDTCGTTVSFSGIDPKFNYYELVEYLKLEFAWYLELRKKDNCSIVLDGVPLDYSDILVEQDDATFTHERSKTTFNITYCRWDKKLNEELSKYYYIDSKGNEIAKEYTSLNKKGDKFYHSVYIKSDFFDTFNFTKDDDNQMVLGCKTKSDPEFKFIKYQVDKYLRAKRTPFIREYTQQYLQDLNKVGAFPEYSDDNPFDKFKKEALEEMISDIYCAEPKIFSGLNIIQKRTLIRVFDLVMNTGETESFFKILDGILDLSADEKEEFAATLEYVKMSSISKVINLLADRKKAVDYLKQLVFDNEKYTLETPHLQEFIEKHYWLFGEQFHLVTAEEPDFIEALRRFTYILTGEKKPRSAFPIEHEHVHKQMDIFAVRQAKDGNIKKCVVVELKKPTIQIGRTELDQVKKYFDVILTEARFNAPNMEWCFFLVGNKIKDELKSEFENAKHHGERSLVFKAERHKIYVKTWSEIIADFEIGHDFIMGKLELEQENLIKLKKQTPSEIVKEQEHNSAAMPAAVVV